MSGKGRKLTPDWVERFDSGSEKYYYGNLKTKETRWEFPEEAKEVYFAWRGKEDPTTGKKYFYNKVTRETSWTNPTSIGGGWEEQLHADSGRIYYFHADRKETTWKRPPHEQATALLDRPATAPTSKAAPAQAQAPALPPAPAVPAGAGAGAAAATAPATPPATAAAGAGSASAPEKKKDRFAALRQLADDPSGLRETTEEDRPEVVKATPKAVMKLLKRSYKPVPEAPLATLAEEHFNMKRKGLLNSRTTVDKVLAWKPVPIKTALLLLPSDLNPSAVQLFRNVTGYMGDRTTGKEGGGHIEKLLRAVVGGAQPLADEAFCQLVKQTNKNPDAESTRKGWRLFVACAGSFPASTKILPFIAWYMHSEVASRGPNADLAEAALTSLQLSCESGPRSEVPLNCEVLAAMDLHPTPVRVYLPLGDYKTIPVFAYTRVADVEAAMAALLGIKDASTFAIFECADSGDTFQQLRKNARMVDAIAYWQRVYEQGLGAGKRHEDTFHFVYKPFLFLRVPESDPAAVELTFMQAVSDITEGTYPCEEGNAISLGALQAQARFGNASEEAPVITAENLEQFLPRSVLQRGGDGADEATRRAELLQRLTDGHKALNDFHPVDAMQEYLEIVQEFELYGSTFFLVSPLFDRDADDVFLAVNARSVLVVDASTKQVSDRVLYSKLPSWSNEEGKLTLNVGDMNRSRKLYYMTDQGPEITDMITAYVSRLLDNVSGQHGKE